MRDIAVIVVIALVASWGVRTFLVRSFYVPSASMETTLMINDRIIVNDLYPEVFALQRGDVVVFEDPGGWLSESERQQSAGGNLIAEALSWIAGVIGFGSGDTSGFLVKRIIGMPGDQVECCDAAGRLMVNGVAIDETYVPEGVAPSETEFSVTVPADSLWVMGDNRSNSADSRANVDGPSHGFVPVSDVVGRAVAISWPVSRWRSLSNYPEVFESVPESSDDGAGSG